MPWSEIGIIRVDFKTSAPGHLPGEDAVVGRATGKEVVTQVWFVADQPDDIVVDAVIDEVGAEEPEYLATMSLVLEETLGEDPRTLLAIDRIRDPEVWWNGDFARPYPNLIVYWLLLGPVG